ncbi:hypothetical protein LCGC14_1118800 [marine sediment metagenome]|uniref:Uncharacterized protein n=1 Tax=marine sediment metagenome TaxID=412755 RepID=A0A0F9M4K3_9ZZZZ
MRHYTINKFAVLIKDILKSNRDVVIVFSGFSGEGKTTFGVHIGKAVSNQFGRTFSFSKNMAISADDFLEKALKLPRYSVVMGDEAINIFFKRESLNKDRIKAIKIMDTIRKRNLCLILNIPQFWSLDSHILQGKVRFWGYIDKRKACHMFKPIRHPFSEDVWNRRINKKAVWNWDDLSYISKIKNYIGTFEFEKMSKEDEAEYNKYFESMMVEQEKKIFKTVSEFRNFIKDGELMGILKLRNSKMLKHGALLALAQMEGVGGTTVTERLNVLEKNMNKYLKTYNGIFTKNLKVNVQTQ